MAEPATTAASAAGAASVTGGLVILLGPVIGPWVAVLLTAIIGSLWTIGRIDTQSRAIAALILLRIVLTALALTGIVAALVADYVSAYLPSEHLLPAVSFCLSAFGDKLKEFKDIAATRLRALIGGANQSEGGAK